MDEERNIIETSLPENVFVYEVTIPLAEYTSLVTERAVFEYQVEELKAQLEEAENKYSSLESDYRVARWQLKEALTKNAEDTRA